jgi:low temperature requirement protein LtrA
MTGHAPSIISPHDQKVTFVELFFDLVFVFSVTQVVGLLHDGLDWGTVGRAVLVFWLVWWAWTQFTWALNAADTTHHLVELGTLVATAVAFFMAVAVPLAFDSPWFAISYVGVRVIGLALYGWVAAAEDPTKYRAVCIFATVSGAGLVSAITGALIGGTAQYWLWGLTIVLDVIAAAIGGRAEGWNLHPEHFAERHGLFVIIALGETLIVAASGMTGIPWTSELIAAAILSVAIACALWWSYFTRTKPTLDRALEAQQGPAQSTMARDAFSLSHFPMLCGVISYAAAIGAAMSHPADPFPLEFRLALSIGLVLFVGSMALAIRRATGTLLLPRLVIAAATAAGIVLWADGHPTWSLATTLAGLTFICAAEQKSSNLAVVEHGEDVMVR